MTDAKRELFRDLGLLFLRVGAGAMMAFGHGLPKLLSFSDKAEQFADPIGVGPTLSLVLAIGAELGCSLLVMFGAFTRVATGPVIFTMLVAALVIHADDPWARKEFALIYLVPFATLALTGAGRFSVDDWMRRRKTK